MKHYEFSAKNEQKTMQSALRAAQRPPMRLAAATLRGIAATAN
jgi:hypothetical protein